MFHPFQRALCILIFILLMGCQPIEPAVPIPKAVPEPSITQVASPTPLARFDPTDPELIFGDGVIETSPLFQRLHPETLVPVVSIEELPHNIATGATAPEFEAYLTEGGVFNIVDDQEGPILVIPTALGCAECIVNLRNLAKVYPDYSGLGLRVLVLDIVLGNDPKTWERFAVYLNEPEILWGVVSSSQFSIDYDIFSLGTVMLIDSDTNLVFRNDDLMTTDGFRQLLELAVLPKPQPTITLTAPPPPTTVPEPTSTPEVTGFKAVPGNIATGESALDFTMVSLTGDSIGLTNWHGQHILLLPTTPGCGECMRNINILDRVYPDFRSQGVQVVFLDFSSENDPAYWEFLASNVGEPEYFWGVVDSSFVLDYEISTLGTILLIDPNGDIVYRNDSTQSEKIMRELFELATLSQG